MYDDNTTPAWALFWAHGLEGKREKGWTIAHVWPASGDIDAYTHLANLALVPEPFAGLTDKNGPLTPFLRWHAWYAYCWKPSAEDKLEKPDGYEQIEWRYLDAIVEPWKPISEWIDKKSNQRTRILQPIMRRRG